MPPPVVEAHMRPTCGSCRSTALTDCGSYYYCRVCMVDSYKVIPALDKALGKPIPSQSQQPLPTEGIVAINPFLQAVCKNPEAKANMVEIAGVAQSAEQVPRKDEAVGSTPTSSSRGLNVNQQEKVRALVRRRVQLEDARVDKRKAQEDLTLLEANYTSTKGATLKRISNAKEKIELYETLTLESEAELRKSIIEEMLVSGEQIEPFASKPVGEEVPLEDGYQECQLGRDE